MAIAITIKPQHLCNILKGKKIGEVRKNKTLINAIKKEIAEKGKAIIYCICGKKEWYLIRDNRCNDYYICHKNRFCEMDTTDTILNGKVVCKFECKYADDIVYGITANTRTCDSYKDYEYELQTIDFEEKELCEKACLTQEELDKYFESVFEKSKDWFKETFGTFINISNLTPFENGKEIKELKVYDKSYDNVGMWGWAFSEDEKYCPLKKAPQNFAYVEDTL